MRETKEETGVAISKEDIEQLHIFSTSNQDPCGWAVTVSHLAFTGEEPLTAGDDTKEVHWSTLERHGSKINLSSGEVAISFDLVTGGSSGKDTLAFDRSQIVLKAFSRTVSKMEHEP